MGQSTGHFQKWERLFFTLLYCINILHTYINLHTFFYFVSKFGMCMSKIMEVMSKCREKEEEEEEKEEVGEDEILKRRISTHPSYGLLLEAHLGCLKVGDNGELESYHTRDQKQEENSPSLGMASRSELDHFMESYCLALRKLKEAMEEPQQKSMAFINNMHSQLKELTSTHPVPADHPAASSAE